MVILDNIFGHLLPHPMNVRIIIAVHVLSPILISPHHHLLVMTTSVRLVCHILNIGKECITLMIHCGMVKVAVQTATAVHSTIHHGFVSNYYNHLM